MGRSGPATGPRRTLHCCSTCGRGFTHAGYLNIHVCNRQLVCKTCGKSFLYPSGLRTHEFSHGPRQHACSTCDRKYASPSTLIEHEKTHAVGYKTPRCGVCGKKFNSLDVLRRHPQKCHMGTHKKSPFSSPVVHWRPWM